MKKIDGLKVAGFAAMVLGSIISMVSSYINDKQTEITIDEKITEKLGEALTKNN